MLCCCVVVGVSCFGTEEVSGGVEVVEVGFSLVGLDVVEGMVSDVVVVVDGVGVTFGDTGPDGETEFWRGMSWAS